MTLKLYLKRNTYLKTEASHKNELQAARYKKLDELRW